MLTVVTVKLEAIGDDFYSYFRTSGHKPWVARLSLDGHGRFQREFVRCRKDYRKANAIGSRGVYCYYHLRDGIYEINSPESWSRCRRYFVKVSDGVLSEISRKEAIRCLN